MNVQFTETEIVEITKLAKGRNLSPADLVRGIVLDTISPPRVTVKQVAQVARVSQMTASYALNGTPGEVSEITRKRVRAVAKQLGYRPSLTARSLQSKRYKV